jgi:hypothetical protein
LTRAPRLRHLELTPDGYVAARIRGSLHLVPQATELLVAVMRLGIRGTWRLLRELDEDVARFEDVAKVAEELAEHVFRGSVSSTIRDAHSELRWTFGVGRSHAVGVDLRPSFLEGRWVDAVRYESEIVLWVLRRWQWRDDEAERMVSLYLRELAEILGVPEAADAGIGAREAVLYSNTLTIRAAEEYASGRRLLRAPYDVLKSLLRKAPLSEFEL